MNWKLSQQQVREKWQLGELQSRPGYLEDAKKYVDRRLEPKTYEKTQEKKKEELQRRAKRARETVLLEREEKKRNPEYHVAVSDDESSLLITAVGVNC